jgi:Concanavalin A-like lectin/glucanases superfamily
MKLAVNCTMPSRFFAAAIVVITASSVFAFQLDTAYAELIHRYSFQESANDSVGKVNGKLEGEAKVADGKLVLTNTGKNSDHAKLSYLSFGERILPKTGSATIEVWFTSKCDGQFARVFDFGERGQGYLFLTVDEGNDTARIAISDNAWENEALVRSDSPVNDNKPHMVAVVIDSGAKRLRFYIDGKQQGESEPLGDNSLEKIKGTNHWLGRSLYTTDNGFTGSIDELRIYDTALSADDVAKHFKAGADTVDGDKK